MNSFQNTFGNFVWLLQQCITVGGLGAASFWIPAFLITSYMTVSFGKTPIWVRRRFWWLLLLPVFWSTIGIWGSVFESDTTHGWVTPPSWKLLPIEYGFWAYLAIATTMIVFMRHGRTFATLVVIANLYFVIFMLTLSGMAITGRWL